MGEEGGPKNKKLREEEPEKIDMQAETRMLMTNLREEEPEMTDGRTMRDQIHDQILSFKQTKPQ